MTIGLPKKSKITHQELKALEAHETTFPNQSDYENHGKKNPEYPILLTTNPSETGKHRRGPTRHS